MAQGKRNAKRTAPQKHRARGSDTASGSTVSGPSGQPAKMTELASHAAATGAGTLSEGNASTKTSAPALEPQSLDGSLASKRVNSADQMLTTNQGVSLANNQDSLKAGLRGPTLLEDFILREKITHFDHERIPERVVHARGSAAHGYFEAYESLTEFTRAAPFAQAAKRTPVFVRFSTVAGERGSTDTARDVRGSQSNSIPMRAIGIWWETTCRCSSSRMR